MSSLTSNITSRNLTSPARPFRVTIVHPCVGRYPQMKRYIRTWQMEPLSAATVAALLPADVQRRFYDDRLEEIPFDEPTDLVAISVETYTARRAYQIASEYRRRGVPVVMGGFHATLCPDEVLRHCEAIVLGEAESLLPEMIDDFRARRNQIVYRSQGRPERTVGPDRSIFIGKKYLPIRLVEFARGCRFKCDFCAIQSFFDSTHSHRGIGDFVDEVKQIRSGRQLFFFIDDNLTSNLDAAKEMMRALIPLNIRWVSQTAINVAYDEEALCLMRQSGCQGVLVGFESLDPDGLRQMNKG
ncbi:MAG: radical SAM protein, partial [Planctomycetales bacterium]|nr:radical SAM protein [Planctomycetales bacterium]